MLYSTRQDYLKQFVYVQVLRRQQTVQTYVLCVIFAVAGFVLMHNFSLI